MDPAVEVRLVELRGLHPGWGADRLRYRLGREGVDPLPSRVSGATAAVGQRRSEERPPALAEAEWPLRRHNSVTTSTGRIGASARRK